MESSKSTVILTNTRGMAYALGKAFGLGSVSTSGIITRKGTRILWTNGPVLRHCTPGEYRPRWKDYRLADLPILPDLRFKPIASARDKLKSIQDALASSDRVIHAGTPDTSGQYIVNTLLDHLGWNGTIERLLPISLHPDHLVAPSLTPNANYRAWSEAEKCRIHADWLIGINLSRILTLMANQSTAIPAGRVMTALLALMRDKPQANPVTNVETPSAFDTAHLQAACLRTIGLSPERTLIAAQLLYESGHISYPFTTQKKLDRGLWSSHHHYSPADDLFDSSESHLPGGILILRMPQGRLKPDEQSVFETILTHESRLRNPILKSTRHKDCPLADLYEATTDMGLWAKSADLRDKAPRGVQLGTPRSRHSTLARIFEAGFADMNTLRITEKGRSTLSMTPESVKDPGTFILWETAIASVANSSLDTCKFMQRIQGYVSSLLEASQRSRKSC